MHNYMKFIYYITCGRPICHIISKSNCASNDTDSSCCHLLLNVVSQGQWNIALSAIRRWSTFAFCHLASCLILRCALQTYHISLDILEKKKLSFPFSVSSSHSNTELLYICKNLTGIWNDLSEPLHKIAKHWKLNNDHCHLECSGM
jgi:hypothetical protein